MRHIAYGALLAVLYGAALYNFFHSQQWELIKEAYFP